MTISERLADDLKTAMRAGDRPRVEAIRGARAAIQSAQLAAAKEKYEAAARVIEAELAHDHAAREAALAAISADPHAPLGQEGEEAVIAKELKRRAEAAEMYRKGGREELAAKEEAEAAVLRAYLPAMLDADELRPQIAALIAELGLSGPSGMGKLMPVLQERYKGRAENRTLSALARELLSST
jgi:uncharacterized protein